MEYFSIIKKYSPDFLLFGFRQLLIGMHFLLWREIAIVITHYIFETTRNYQVVVVIIISIITIIIIIIKLRKQGCSETTFVTQKAPCLKIIIIGKVSLLLELSPCLEWSLFWISGTAPLIGMFSLSGPSAKKVIRGESSLAFRITLLQYTGFLKFGYLLEFLSNWCHGYVRFYPGASRTRALIRTYLWTRVHLWLFFCKEITKHYVEFYQQVHI